MNTSAPLNPSALINEARDTLNTKAKKLTSDELDYVDRRINLLCANFHELDDKLALESCGVIGVAIAKGSKNASKKKPKLSRWNLAEPPSVISLPSSQERVGAVSLLKNLKTSWVASYAFINAAQCSDDKNLTSALLKWAETGTTNTTYILLGLTDFFLTLPKSTAKQIEIILKQATLAFESNSSGDGEAFGKEFLKAVKAAEAAIKNNQIYFEKTNPLEALILVCDKASSIDPQILFNPETQNALKILLDSIPKLKKTTSTALSKIGQRFLSLSSWHVQLHGMDQSASILETLRSVDNHLSLSLNAKNTPNYSKLLNKPEPTQSSKTSSVDIYTLASSLLLAWEDLSQSQQLGNSGQELNALIESIASVLGISRFGVVGETVSFDPFRHFIDSTPTPNVSILIPGITVVRKDGSERVLVKAIVNPV